MFVRQITSGIRLDPSPLPVPIGSVSSEPSPSSGVTYLSEGAKCLAGASTVVTRAVYTGKYAYQALPSAIRSSPPSLSRKNLGVESRRMTRVSKHSSY
eukprot:scaffold22580_cov76-Phaeocystis_antarctica.AAC.2